MIMIRTSPLYVRNDQVARFLQLSKRLKKEPIDMMEAILKKIEVAANKPKEVKPEHPNS